MNKPNISVIKTIFTILLFSLFYSCATPESKMYLPPDRKKVVQTELLRLGKSPSEDSAKKLGQYLKYVDFDIQATAADYMYYMYSFAIVALPEMKEALETGNKFTKVYTMRALANLKADGESTHAKIHELEKDPDGDIAFAAKQFFINLKQCNSLTSAEIDAGVARVTDERAKEIIDKSILTPVVYGRPNCGITQSQLRDFRKNKVTYEFLNIDASNKFDFELWYFVKKQLGNKAAFSLPVTIAKGKVYTGYQKDLVASYK